MTHSNMPRRPNADEIEALVKYHLKLQFGDTPTQEEREDMRLRIPECYIAVFDQFVSDSPGYVGKLMLVIWSTGPNMYEAYVWRDGQLDRIAQDLSLFDPMP